MNDTSTTLPRFKTFGPEDRPNLTSPITEQQREAWKVIPEHAPRKAGLVVAGGGLSGVAAAIAAARRGINVIVVEPTHMVGGQATAAGVSAFDITFYYDHAINDHGLWSELLVRIQRIYDDELNRPVNVGHHRNTSFVPNVVVVERVLTEMLAEAGVTVLRNTTIIGALRDHGRVSGLATTAGTVMGHVIIDATEDGQVLGLAGVPHRISNGVSNGTSTQKITSKLKKIQDITYTAVIQAYPAGVPEELRVTVAPEGYLTHVKSHRKIHPPEPAEIPHIFHYGPTSFAGYRAAPDLSSDNMSTGVDPNGATRTNLNFHNDVPVGADYLTDPVVRMKAEALGKLKTISIIYYLQNELGLPWSVCTDEGFADGPASHHNPLVPEIYAPIERHMPVIPYIRESRRIIGTATITGKSIRREPSRTEAVWRADSIAVGTYHPDLHGGRAISDFETYLKETPDDKPVGWREGPFPIPFGALIPEWVDGLIAAEKNISATRLGAAAIRLHPTVFSIGEAAGATAALAIRKGLQPREVPVAAVQLTLAQGGALLTPLYVEGVTKGTDEFVKATVAVARKRAPMEIIRTPHKEPRIRTDLTEAIEAGEATMRFVKDWTIDVHAMAMV